MNDAATATPDGPDPAGVAIPAVVAPIVAVAGDHVPPLLGRIERRLRQVAAPGAASDPLDAAGAATVAAGGKRLRPLLALVVAGPAITADPAAQDAIVRAGVALELTHTATLVHDDVLDAAALRRGRPTTFHAHGRAAATCLGDALFAAAFGELAGGDDERAVRVLAAASRALAQGELLQRADAWRADVGEDRYMTRCRLKTGALFDAAARLGALVAGNEPEAFAAFASAVGVAFQLFDDVLDVVGPPEVTGKPRGTDLLDGTATLPLLVARERDEQLRALDVRSIVTPEQAAAVCDRIVACGATDETERRARALVEDALAALPTALDDGREGALRLIARGVVDRRL
ncbi:polyprenyl synthetase family protein [Patulibacter defluvii]|uniref:polyprenyl synthetase family protein n=1 Tax=Patulibacter defluvii TaxID=3095358 RepID=UPI002A76649A|nr:polyprenyl synthetase family protein [Patulibacter sp. DM4]